MEIVALLESFCLLGATLFIEMNGKVEVIADDANCVYTGAPVHIRNCQAK